MRTDVYQRIAYQIIGELEKGVRPWLQPWSAEHLAGRVMRPLRHNGVGYQGINVIMLWVEAVAKGYTAPIWMTFRQSVQLHGHVRKGEKGSIIVYANSITRTETDEDTNEETAHEIHYLKGYTVFNVEQIEGRPRIITRRPRRSALPSSASNTPNSSFPRPAPTFGMAATAPTTPPVPITSRCRPSNAFATRKAITRTLAHEHTHWTRHPSRLDRDLGRKRWGDAGYTRWRSLSPSLAQPFCAPISP